MVFYRIRRFFQTKDRGLAEFKTTGISKDWNFFKGFDEKLCRGLDSDVWLLFNYRWRLDLSFFSGLDSTVLLIQR